MFSVKKSVLHFRESDGAAPAPGAVPPSGQVSEGGQQPCCGDVIRKSDLEKGLGEESRPRASTSISDTSSTNDSDSDGEESRSRASAGISDTSSTNDSDLDGSLGESATESDNPSLPKIWMMWASGWEEAPLLCQLCAMSWERNNPDFEVVKLDDKSVKRWLPELFATEKDKFVTELDANGKPKVMVAKQTDYIRLKLLETYGGIWADATIMATGSLSEFIKKNKGSDELFVFDRRDSKNWGNDEHSKCPMRDPFVDQQLQFSNWFLMYYPYAAQQGLEMSVADPDRRMAYMSDQLLERFRREVQGEESQLYFAMHYMVQEAPFWKKVWTKMPSVSAGSPHTAEFRLGFFKSIHGEDGAEAKQILETALAKFPGQKLSHKLVSDLELAQLAARDLLRETLLGALIEKAFDGVLPEVITRSNRVVSENKFLEDGLAKGGQVDSVEFLSDLAKAAQIKQQEVYDNWPFLKKRGCVAEK